MILRSCPAVIWLIRYDADDEQHAEADDRQRHAVANRFAEDGEGDEAESRASARGRSYRGRAAPRTVATK